MTPAATVPTPLTIGEIFDRGITLFVRNAPIVLALGALYYLPHAIVDGYDSSKDAIASLVTLVTNPHVAVPVSPGSAKPVLEAAKILRFADFLFVVPLVNAVLLAALGRAYRGSAPTFVGTLRIGISRWRASIVAWLVLLVAVLAAVIPLVVVVALPGVLAAGAALGMHVSGPGLVVVVGIVVTPFALIALAVYLFLVTVSNVVECVVIVEESRGLTAFATAWRRTLRMPRRAILVGGAELCVSSIAGLVANAVGDTIIQLTHLVPLAIAVNAATEVVIVGILAAVDIVYYEDQRVRSEGTDLVVEATLGASPAETLTA